MRLNKNILIAGIFFNSASYVYGMNQQGTASATVSNGITISGQTLSGPSTSIPLNENYNVIGADVFGNLAMNIQGGSIEVINQPKNSELVFTGTPNAPINITITKANLVHTTDSTKFITWKIGAYDNTVSIGNVNYDNNTESFSSAIGGDGTKAITLVPNFVLHKPDLMAGTYIGTYTIQITYA